MSVIQGKEPITDLSELSPGDVIENRAGFRFMLDREEDEFWWITSGGIVPNSELLRSHRVHKVREGYITDAVGNRYVDGERLPE